MWTDNTLSPIANGDDYTDADGTYYPAQFPKADIPGLFPVTETPRPDAAEVIVSGFHIDASHTQVWETQPRPGKTPEELAAEERLTLTREAYRAMTACDVTVLRCMKAGVAFPAEWVAYDAALRAILSGGNGPLPTRPDYPAGT